MTRRSFITNLGALGLFSILPGAGRVWRVERPPVPSMQEQWIHAFFYGEPLSAQVGVCRFEDLQSISFIRTPDDWMENFRVKPHENTPRPLVPRWRHRIARPMGQHGAP